MYLQYYSTVQFCCTCAVNKNTRQTTGTRRDTRHGHYEGTHPRASQGRVLRCELELELIQTQMAQKPMLRAEVGMRVRCANKASAE